MPGILPFSGYFYAALYITPLSVNRNLQMILWNFPYFSRLSKPLLILNIRKVARGYIHFVAYLFPAFLAPFPGCLNCFPKSLKVVSWYWSFCHIHSPYYILLFTFLFGYVYTVPINSLNNSYFCIETLHQFYNAAILDLIFVLYDIAVNFKKNKKQRRFKK